MFFFFFLVFKNWEILGKVEALVEIRIQEGHFVYKGIDDSWWIPLSTFLNVQVAEFGVGKDLGVLRCYFWSIMSCDTNAKRSDSDC